MLFTLFGVKYQIAINNVEKAWPGISQEALSKCEQKCLSLGTHTHIKITQIHDEPLEIEQGLWKPSF